MRSYKHWLFPMLFNLGDRSTTGFYDVCMLLSRWHKSISFMSNENHSVKKILKKSMKLLSERIYQLRSAIGWLRFKKIYCIDNWKVISGRKIEVEKIESGRKNDLLFFLSVLKIFYFENVVDLVGNKLKISFLILYSSKVFKISYKFNVLRIFWEIKCIITGIIILSSNFGYAGDCTSKIIKLKKINRICSIFQNIFVWAKMEAFFCKLCKYF